MTMGKNWVVLRGIYQILLTIIYGEVVMNPLSSRIFRNFFI